jgi:hypothetical protein
MLSSLTSYKDEQNKNITLKVLSSEMDQAKSGIIRKLFIKGRGAENFIKIGLPL